MRNLALVLSTLLVAAITSWRTPAPLGAQAPAADGAQPAPRERSVRSRVIGLVRGSEEEPGALESAPGEKSATLRKGWIPVVDLLRFIEETTGQPVVYPSVSVDPHFGSDAGIHFLADQEGFDAAAARFYLERNGFEFTTEEISPGRSAVVVHHRFQRSAAPRGMPVAELVIGPDEAIPAVEAGTRAILVCSLDHSSSDPVTQALREMFTPASSGGMTQFFAIAGSSIVIAIAPVEQLATIRETVAVLDVDIDLPTPESRPAGNPAREVPSGSGGR